MCPKCGCSPAAENGPGGDATAARAASARPELAVPGTQPNPQEEQQKEQQEEQQEEQPQEWYYVTASGRSGPVMLSLLQQLAADGEITDQTLVWKAGMADWVEFSRYQGSAPDALAAGPVTPWSAPQWSLWVLAFAPAWGGGVQILATEAWVALTHKQLGYYAQFWWVLIAANLGAAALDFEVLKRSGQDVASIDKGRLLLIPLYLYLRKRKLRKRILLVAIWTGSLMISLSGCLYLNSAYARLVAR